MTPSRFALHGLLFAAAGALVLAGCSSGASGAPSTRSSAARPPSRAPGALRQGTAFAPAAQGEIADITGKTLQVQSGTDQTAVTYTAKTTFTAERTVGRGSVHVGRCIVATAASSNAASSATVTATSVRITGTGASGCTGGFGEVRPSGLPSGVRPSGLPTGVRPSGVPSRAAGRAFGAAVAGKVTAISGSTITVQALTRPAAGLGSASTTARTVLVTSKTTYTMTATATATALKVGLCAVVQGSTNSSGAVTASRIALSPASGGSCRTTRFPGGPNG